MRRYGSTVYGRWPLDHGWGSVLLAPVMVGMVVLVGLAVHQHPVLVVGLALGVVRRRTLLRVGRRIVRYLTRSSGRLLEDSFPESVVRRLTRMEG